MVFLCRDNSEDKSLFTSWKEKDECQNFFIASHQKIRPHTIISSHPKFSFSLSLSLYLFIYLFIFFFFFCDKLILAFIKLGMLLLVDSLVM